MLPANQLLAGSGEMPTLTTPSLMQAKAEQAKLR
jgi:hypothetical protein